MKYLKAIKIILSGDKKILGKYASIKSGSLIGAMFLIFCFPFLVIGQKQDYSDVDKLLLSPYSGRGLIKEVKNFENARKRTYFQFYDINGTTYKVPQENVLKPAAVWFYKNSSSYVDAKWIFLNNNVNNLFFIYIAQSNGLELLGEKYAIQELQRRKNGWKMLAFHLILVITPMGIYSLTNVCRVATKLREI
jgi:hypothetical protein